MFIYLILVSMMAGEDGVVTENTSVSPEVIKALTNQTLSPDDIEIVSDSDGKSVIRVKSGHSQVGTQETTIKGVKEGHIYTQPNQSLLTPRALMLTTVDIMCFNNTCIAHAS